MKYLIIFAVLFTSCTDGGYRVYADHFLNRKECLSGVQYYVDHYSLAPVYGRDQKVVLCEN